MELAVLCSTSGATFCSVPLPILPLGRLGGTTANRFGSQLCLPTFCASKSSDFIFSTAEVPKFPLEQFSLSTSRLLNRFMRNLCAFHHDSQQQIEEGWIANRSLLLLSLPETGKLPSLLGCTARANRDSWINKMRSNLLRYQCGLSAPVYNRCDPM